jgi:tetratricopeptide (TPR) repeat protein
MSADASGPGGSHYRAPADRALEAAHAVHRSGDHADALARCRALLADPPKAPEPLRRLGVLAAQLGLRREALPLLRAALEARPTMAQFWVSYIETLYVTGDFGKARDTLALGRRHGLGGQAVELLSARIAQALDEATALERLEAAQDYARLQATAEALIAEQGRTPQRLQAVGKALLLQGKDAAALAWLTEACDALPEAVDAWNQLGLALNHLERFEEAQRCFERALGLHPQAVEVLGNCADNCNDAGRFAEALPFCERALALVPGDVVARVNKARALLELGREDEGLALLRALHVEGVRLPGALLAFAQGLRRFGDPTEAAAVFAQMLGLEPENSAALLGLAITEVDQGRFDAAEALIDRAIGVQPDAIGAWALIPATRKMLPADRPWLVQAERLLATAPSAGKTYPLRYAMGKCCDDLGAYGEAFEHYREANALKRQFCQRYDRVNQEKLVSLLMRGYGRRPNARTPGSDSARPVLIVGMPRSGTSLLEQIVASHPHTFGAGELTFWRKQFRQHRRAAVNGRLLELPLREMASAYLEELARCAPASAQRVVDKMPSNFAHLGLIMAVFPNARVLHTMRNPVDTCLSIYFQDFHLGHAYANDLSDLAHYYCQYHRLMAHWRDVLPADRFLEVPYEALLDDQEGWSRRLIAFLGLTWDPGCLAFHKTVRKVGTASNWQARQPLYKTSRERWRNYRDFVTPLLPLLDLYDPERGQLPGVGGAAISHH